MKTFSRFVVAAGMIVAAGSAFAKTFECKSSTNPGEIYLSYDAPCPSGRDANVLTPAERVEKANNEAVSKRQVLIGMTREQVARAWGNPPKYGNSGEGSGGQVEIWQYGCPGTFNAFDRNADPNNWLKIMTLTFEDGKLAKMVKMCGN